MEPGPSKETKMEIKVKPKIDPKLLAVMLKAIYSRKKVAVA